MALKPRVEAAIADLREVFPTLTYQEDSDGGAIVKVEGVSLNTEVFVQSETWVGFHITFQYPDADVYPHHVRPDLVRRDGLPLSGNGIHPGNSFHGLASTMLSRRTNRRSVRRDTALKKLVRVMAWLEQWPEPKTSS